MAQLPQDNSLSKKHSSRNIKRSLSIDMTPLVDLGFLLLTFFILTTTLMEMRTIIITVPQKEKSFVPTKIPESQTFNIILLKNKIGWYIGADDKISHFLTTTFDLNANESLLKTLRKNDSLVKSKNTSGLYIFIKSSADSKYSSLIKAFDMIHLASIDRYYIVDLTETEKKFLNVN